MLSITKENNVIPSITKANIHFLNTYEKISTFKSFLQTKKNMLCCKNSTSKKKLNKLNKIFFICNT
jgi:ssDNA-specific exonuclease RecJ